jgi:hypothetical protein
LGDRRFAIDYPKLALISTVFGAVVVVPASWIAFESISPLVGYLIVAAIAICPGYALNQVEVGNAQYLQVRRRLGLGWGLPPVLEFSLNVVFILLQRLNIVVCLVITLAVEGSRGLMAIIWNRRDFRDLPSSVGRPNRQLNMKLWKATFINAPSAVIPMLSGNLDVLIFGALVDTASLGHYVVAKLAFNAMLIVGGLLEGRALGLVYKFGISRAALAMICIGAGLSFSCGFLGWVFTPVLFGIEFQESARAFPITALAGFLAFMFVSLNAIEAKTGHASTSRRIMPGAVVLLSLVASCMIIPAVFGSNVVAMAFALAGSQFLGFAFLSFFSSNTRKVIR